MPWPDNAEAMFHGKTQTGIAAVRPSGSGNVSRLQEENGSGQAARVRLNEQQPAPGTNVAESTAQKRSTRQAAHRHCYQASGTDCSQGGDENLSGCGTVPRLERRGGKMTGLKQKPPEQPVIVSGDHRLIRRRTCGHI